MTFKTADDVVARGRLTIIRTKRMQDAPDEYRWRSDPDLARFDASRPVQVPFESYERNWSFDFRFTDMPRRAFAVEDPAGRHIGNIMYYNIDTGRAEAEIGISIGEPRYWSHGYGTDAIDALVTALFDSSDLRRLYLHTLDWNKRAHRAFEKAGFEACGTSWRDGNTFIVMELWRHWREDVPAPARHAVA